MKAERDFCLVMNGDSEMRKGRERWRERKTERERKKERERERVRK